jgi:hypothetical protein
MINEQKMINELDYLFYIKIIIIKKPVSLHDIGRIVRLADHRQLTRQTTPSTTPNTTFGWYVDPLLRRCHTPHHHLCLRERMISRDDRHYSLFRKMIRSDRNGIFRAKIIR